MSHFFFFYFVICSVFSMWKTTGHCFPHTSQVCLHYLLMWPWFRQPEQNPFSFKRKFLFFSCSWMTYTFQYYCFETVFLAAVETLVAKLLEMDLGLSLSLFNGPILSIPINWIIDYFHLPLLFAFLEIHKYRISNSLVVCGVFSLLWFLCLSTSLIHLRTSH